MAEALTLRHTLVILMFFVVSPTIHQVKNQKKRSDTTKADAASERKESKVVEARKIEIKKVKNPKKMKE